MKGCDLGRGTSKPEEDIRRKVHVGVDILRERLATEVEVGTTTCLKLRLLAGASPPALHISLYVERTWSSLAPTGALAVSLSVSTLGPSPVGEERTNIPGQVSSFCILSPHVDLFRILGSPLPLVQPLLRGPAIVNTGGCFNESFCFQSQGSSPSAPPPSSCPGNGRNRSEGEESTRAGLSLRLQICLFRAWLPPCIIQKLGVPAAETTQYVAT